MGHKINRYVIDAFAWIDYIESGPFSIKIEELLQKDECYTCSGTVAEVLSKVLRKKGNAKECMEAIYTLSKIIPITEGSAHIAGTFHSTQRKIKKQFGLGDAFVYAAALEKNAKILTNDHHFEDLKETIMLKNL
jgi:predicted nucleic acid-binding protein|tara:strand:- start:163 stop:564 length:402 start_codon:yes stop_codon:yes gene_type:complete